MGCISCGHEVTDLLPLPSHLGNLKACSSCISKHGAEKIAREADRLLTDWYLNQPPPPTCLVCGEPVLINNDGSRPLWCQKCEKKRVNYVNAQARR